MNSYAIPTAKSTLSEEREETFVYLSNVASQLRNRIYYNDQRYPYVQTNYEFRRLFDHLFTITADKADIPTDLKKNISLWLSARNPRALAGLKLFNLYKEQLFKHNIIDMV